MKEQFYLSIPEPCHEDWNKMTTVEQGRHCAVCKKNVVDFTDADDEAIVDFFKNYNGSACGRFTNEQLNRPLSKIELKPASNFLKYAAGLLLPGLMLSKAYGQKQDTIDLKEIVVTGYGQKRVGKVAFTQPIAGPIRLKVKDTLKIKPLKPRPIEDLLVGKLGGVQMVRNYVYHGVITDEIDESPIQGASIQIIGTNTVTTSDAQGRFDLSSLGSSIKLIVTSVGYEQKEVIIDKTNFDMLNIKMKPHVMGMGEVIVVGTVRKKKKYVTGTGSVKITSQKIKLTDSIQHLFSFSKISAYPNPVALNGTLQLNFGKSKPGLYQIRLLNSSGQLFYSFQKQISSPNETEQIHFNEKMSEGVYVLQIIDDKKRLVQTSKIVVQ